MLHRDAWLPNYSAAQGAAGLSKVVDRADAGRGLIAADVDDPALDALAAVKVGQRSCIGRVAFVVARVEERAIALRAVVTVRGILECGVREVQHRRELCCLQQRRHGL